MNSHVEDFFEVYSEDTSKGNFHAVIRLHENEKLNWGTLQKKVPGLPRGWCELARLPKEDRIGFTHDFWLSRFPFHPHLGESLDSFFSNIDDIGFYLTQKKFDDPFEAHMVYCISKNRGFYRGGIPANEDELFALQKNFSEFVLPQDYLAFMEIHNGFWKATDTSGLIRIENMKMFYNDFQKSLEELGFPHTTGDGSVNPHTLIPFYESFGMPFFQCFWAEWHPEDEMGNVYYSSSTNTISKVDAGGSSNPESMSFKSFTEWLIFYLEQVT